MPQQRDDTVAEEARRRVVAGDDELEERRQQLLVVEPFVAVPRRISAVTRSSPGTRSLVSTSELSCATTASEPTFARVLLGRVGG